MNQPPHGWQQPPPGWQQPPPGYGYPPPPPLPPKKSKAPLIFAIIAGVLVLGSLATGLVVYLDVHKDGGEPKRADQLPALCGNVSEAALAQARTTNPNKLGSSELEMGDDGKRTICSWHQTKGVDGTGYRGVDVYVQTASDMSMDELVAQHMKAAGVPRQKPLDGLGDQAVAVLVEGNSALTDIWILVRKGDTTVQVDYTGWDAGLFTNTKPDVTEFEAAAKSLASDMVSKL